MVGLGTGAAGELKSAGTCNFEGKVLKHVCAEDMSVVSWSERVRLHRKNPAGHCWSVPVTC